MPLSPDFLLRDRYRIKTRLASGGMGAVYIAFDQTLQLRVAVKENHSPHPDSERQFLREAKLLASLRHSNLPRVTDHFVLGNNQYLVMDFIEGDDLEQIILDNPPRPEEVLQWAAEICDALAYLHSRTTPIIHRDIKPANIKINPDGKPILVDFGIAKEFDAVSKTTTGARGLTPGFSPPEQYGTGQTDIRSDQYALAATLYNLLTLERVPDSMSRLLHNTPFKSPRSMNPAVSKTVSGVIMKALELKAADRFIDISAFKNALQGQYSAPTIRADSISATIPASHTLTFPKPGRKFLSFFLGSAAVIILLGGAFFLGRNLIAPKQEPTVTVPIVSNVSSRTPVASITATSMPSATPTPTSTSTPTPAPTATPVPPVLGGSRMLAFVSDRGDDNILQIYTMHTDGSHLHQLTYGTGEKIQPRWSPDGQFLAFVSDHEGNREIYIMPAEGGPPVNVTNNPFDEMDPAWSADGSQLAFSSTRKYEVRQVFIMDINCDGIECSTSEPFNISRGFADEFSPAWAPSAYQPPWWLPERYQLAVSASIMGIGAQIYFRSYEDTTAVDMDRQEIIFGAEQLDWSPDGETIVFTWFRPGSNEIYLVRVEDRGYSPIKLTRSLGNRDPVFSPDGQFFAFTSTRDQNPDIYIMTVSGANQTQLTDHIGRDMYPAWYPIP